jgi:hypothetical protein
VKAIQMKLMKMIDTLKNTPIQELQHCSESKLIQVMKMKMPVIQFVFIVKVIQTKLMKMMYSMQNNSIQEFQHCLESKLTEVFNLQRPMIQFVLIVRVIQTKLTKMIYSVKNSLIQELQHCLESKLIEVMKIERHSIQFVLIVKVIQIKWMKSDQNLKYHLNHDLNHMAKKQFQQSEEPKLEKSRTHVDNNMIGFSLFHLTRRGIGSVSTPKPFHSIWQGFDPTLPFLRGLLQKSTLRSSTKGRMKSYHRLFRIVFL